MSANITVRDLFKAGVHFGHKTRYWNPKMEPYIFTTSNNIHIIDLDKTYPLLKNAIDFVGRVAARGGRVLFVGTKFAAQEIIRDEAVRCSMPFVDQRWLGGTLTNYKTMRASIKQLKELEKMQKNGTFEKMIKKEALSKMRQLNKLERSLGGIKNMGGIPDAIFIIDVGQEQIAIAEANRLSIPVIGVVDTNNSPKGVDYVIPGNDDAGRSIRLLTRAMADTILEKRPIKKADVINEDEFVEIKKGKVKKGDKADGDTAKKTKPKAKVSTAKAEVAESADVVEKAAEAKEDATAKPKRVIKRTISAAKAKDTEKKATTTKAKTPEKKTAAKKPAATKPKAPAKKATTAKTTEAKSTAKKTTKEKASKDAVVAKPKTLSEATASMKKGQPAASDESKT